MATVNFKTGRFDNINSAVIISSVTMAIFSFILPSYIADDPTRSGSLRCHRV